MRIISKFHDYYDTASAYGIDMECVYVRHTKETTSPLRRRVGNHTVQMHMKDKRDSPMCGKYFEYPSFSFLVGFCGEIYPGISITKQNPYYRTGNEKPVVFYSAQDVSNYVASEGFDPKYGDGRFYLRDDGYDYALNSEQKLIEFFGKDRNQFKDLFREYHCPVWAIGPGIKNPYRTFLILDPRLQPYMFYRVKDPVTAFQEIHQYLSGVLGNKEKDAISTDDKYLVHSKGFNKWSFRNEPGKKRSRH
jgi:hypothetical protein